VPASSAIHGDQATLIDSALWWRNTERRATCADGASPRSDRWAHAAQRRNWAMA